MMPPANARRALSISVAAQPFSFDIVPIGGALPRENSPRHAQQGTFGIVEDHPIALRS
jgi:hypothetical protein